MNKIEILRFLSYSCVAGLFIYAWQTVGTKRNWKQLILPVTLAVLGIIFTISKNTEEKKAEQIAAEKAEQMYYEEMFSQPKMNLQEKGARAEGFSEGFWQALIFALSEVKRGRSPNEVYNDDRVSDLSPQVICNFILPDDAEDILLRGVK